MCVGSPRAKRGWYPTCQTPNCPAVTDEQDEQGGTHFDHWTEAEAIAAWNTRAALRPADHAGLVEAAIGLRDDMLERAEIGLRDAVKIVAAGNGAWFRFNEALDAATALRNPKP